MTRWATVPLIFAGCQVGQRAPYTESPLLVSRPPHEHSSKATLAAPIANTPPPTALPGPPADVRPRQHRVDNYVVKSLPPHEPELPVAVVEIPTPADPSLDAPLQRKAPGSFAHASDYTWLQGVIQLDSRGQRELRFAPLEQEDPHDGIVRLADDARLHCLTTGDIVVVQGELVETPSSSVRMPARYIVRQFQRLVQAP